MLSPSVQPTKPDSRGLGTLGNDGLRVHDINAIDLGKIGSADPVELAAQIKRGGGIVARLFVGFGRRQLAGGFALVRERLQMGL